MANQKLNLQFELNDDYYQIFRPFYYVYTLFGLRTYNLKNGVAFPITKLNIGLGILASFVMATCFCLTLLWSNFPDITTKAIYSFQYVLYVTIFLIQPAVNFYFKNNNFKLLMTFQEIGKISKNSDHARSLSVLVWAFLVLISLYYGMFICIRWQGDVHWTWPRAVIILTAILFEMKVLHVSFLMLYMALKLRTWKMIMMSYQLEEYDEINGMLNQLKSTFKLILGAYSMTKKVCQVFVLMCFVMSFLEFLTLEALFLIWTGWNRGKYAELNPMTILVYGWMIKMVVIQVVLCVSCEIFYVEIANVREAVIIKTSKGHSNFHVVQRFENLKDFTKSICRIIDSHFTKMSACSVFTVDASLFLRFLATVATYTVVLLQFAF